MSSCPALSACRRIRFKLDSKNLRSLNARPDRQLHVFSKLPAAARVERLVIWSQAAWLGQAGQLRRLEILSDGIFRRGHGLGPDDRVQRGALYGFIVPAIRVYRAPKAAFSGLPAVVTG